MVGGAASLSAHDRIDDRGRGGRLASSSTPSRSWGSGRNEQLVTVMVTNYCIKVGWEALATPITYRVVAWLKRVEHEDYFDRDTDFNPFTLAGVGDTPLFHPKPRHCGETLFFLAELPGYRSAAKKRVPPTLATPMGEKAECPLPLRDVEVEEVVAALEAAVDRDGARDETEDAVVHGPSIRIDEQEMRLASLLVAREEHRRNAAGDAADRAGAVNFEAPRVHHAEKALRIDDLAGELAAAEILDLATRERAAVGGSDGSKRSIVPGTISSIVVPSRTIRLALQALPMAPSSPATNGAAPCFPCATSGKRSMCRRRARDGVVVTIKTGTGAASSVPCHSRSVAYSYDARSKGPVAIASAVATAAASTTSAAATRFMRRAVSGGGVEIADVERRQTWAGSTGVPGACGFGIDVDASADDAHVEGLRPSR